MTPVEEQSRSVLGTQNRNASRRMSIFKLHFNHSDSIIELEYPNRAWNGLGRTKS